MDAGLLWTAGGTVAGFVALGVASWQLRLQMRQHHSRPALPDAAVPPPSPSAADGPETAAAPASVLAPLRSLPAEIRGRQEQLRELLGLAEKSTGHAVVLAGLGGIGKSTVAAALAERVRADPRRHVWWVSAAEEGSLPSGMLAVARALGAPVAEQEAIASGTSRAPDALWAVLDREKRRWLLVIDNADAPQALAAPGSPPGSAGVADGTGWLRVPRSGLVVVTTRHADPATWGRGIVFRRLDRLDAADAGRILRDLAPAAGTEEQATELGERLGGLPLALHLAGSYLGSDFALTRGFADYRRELDGSPRTVDLLAPDPELAGDSRSTLMYTWETSLDALARYGVPQARTLLRLLSCLGAATPVPDDLLDVALLAALLPPEAVERTEQVVWLEQGMRGLLRLGLLNRLDPPPSGSGGRALMVHPVVADVGRAHLEADRQAGGAAARTVPATAVLLVTEALARLAPDRPADWPAFRLLTPHFRSLLSTAAPVLDPDGLRLAARGARMLADYSEWSGPAAIGEEICAATLAVVGALSSGDREVLDLRYSLCRAVALQGRWTEAEEGLQLLLVDQREHLGDADRSTLRTEGELARVVADLGCHTEARATLAALLETQRVNLGEQDPDTLDTYHVLGRVEAHTGGWAEAEALFRTARDGRAAAFGIDHPVTLASRNRLAWTIGQQGRAAEAGEELQEVLRIRRELFGDEHHDTLATRERLGWVLGLQGRLVEAEEELTAVVAERTRLLGPDYSGTLSSSVLLARVVAQRGRQEEAAALLADLHRRQSRLFGPDHPQTRETGHLLDGLGNG
ncbi:tetratricopeptide repeat protein [Kitasatospora purpeofusca]|uniref:tetratricopeptide repeat protein n=1 Tax=Kitasatospora purpeofusca TaxID=67352 RepID=UPI002A5ADE16|nr:tetratricopeptide repeat protein [Kitasatospora purpeofusca]MDY0810738.1 tetratricopeptide repeat protein [Kitasatospora purpeofusca]